MENEAHELAGSKLMRVAIYARVSGPSQGVPETQIDDLEKFCAYKGYTIVGKFIDTVTGDVEKRQKDNIDCNRDEMMKGVESKEFDAVVVWKYDRFARSVIDLCSSLEIFKRVGVGWISIKDGIDTSTPTGMLMFHILASFAEFERKVIAERCLAGIRRVQETGLDRHGKPVSLGCKTRLGKPIATTEQKERIISSYKAGNTFRVIALAEGMPINTVYSILQNGTMVKCEHGKYRCIKCGTRPNSYVRPQGRSVKREIAISPGSFAETLLRKERG